MKTYSFIIPHKNCAYLLSRCLDSIPIRDDVEIIIVDDDSDPALVDFDNFPGINRKNTICVFLKKSRGAGHARNVGIAKSSGKWLLFADCDDYYTKAIDKVLDKYASDEMLDVVYLNSVKVDDNGMIHPLSINRYIDNFIRRKSYSESVLRYGFWTPWSRMVKRDFVQQNHIVYEEVPVANDACFCLYCSLFAKNIEAVSDIVYCYYQFSSNSVTGSYYNLTNLSSRLKTHLTINKIYKKANYRFMIPTLYSFRTNKSMNTEQKKEYRRIRKYVLKENDYSFILDVKRLVVYLIAKIAKII